jgi:hypothetical protein
MSETHQREADCMCLEKNTGDRSQAKRIPPAYPIQIGCSQVKLMDRDKRSNPAAHRAVSFPSNHEMPCELDVSN